MFDKFIASFLEQYLKEFCSNFDTNSIHLFLIDFWFVYFLRRSLLGTFEVNNLLIRPDALENLFHDGIQVISGEISKLLVSIGIALWSGPIIITFEDVYLLCRPQKISVCLCFFIHIFFVRWKKNQFKFGEKEIF